jgi:hypothetical protein
MDNKDKIIKKLMENDVDIKAPDDFTNEVMKSVMAFEESKKTSQSINSGMLFLIIFLSVLSSLAVFYYYDNSLISNIVAYFSSAISFLSIDLSAIGSSFSDGIMNTKSVFNSSPILFPLTLGLAALIIVERILSGFKSRFNLMISW